VVFANFIPISYRDAVMSTQIEWIMCSGVRSGQLRVTAQLRITAATCQRAMTNVPNRETEVRNVAIGRSAWMGRADYKASR